MLYGNADRTRSMSSSRGAYAALQQCVAKSVRSGRPSRFGGSYSAASQGAGSTGKRTHSNRALGPEDNFDFQITFDTARNIPAEHIDWLQISSRV
jgi:hypothetical protein